MKFDIFKPLVIHEQGRQTSQGNAIFPAPGEGTIHDRLFVVCEGQGDEKKAKLAGSAVASTLSDYIFQNTCPDEPMEEDVLKNALVEVYDTLNGESTRGAAVTMAMLYFHRHGCLAAHIGNNRIYHIRPKNHALMYRSRDNANTMTSKGYGMAEPIKAFITDVRFGDYFVLMTKEATSKLNDQKVMDIVCANGSDEDKLAKFKNELDDCQKNHSLYFIHVSGVMNEAFDEELPDNEQRLMAAYLSGTNENKPQRKEEKPVVEEKDNTPEEPEEETTQQIEEQDEPVKEKKTKKKREFPVVWVTAILLIIGAAALLYWAHGKATKHAQQQPELKVKEDVKKEKDSFNVMKNAKNKPLELTAEEKAKMEEDKKKAEEERKKKEEERKKAEEEKKRQEEENNMNSSQEPSKDNSTPATQETTREPVTPPQQSANPAGEPQNTNTTPPANSNELKPVIPPN